jgi:hypothetical protein
MTELTPEIMRAARKALAAAGGKARARKLSKQRQSEIGRHAVSVRWAKAKRKKAKAKP